MIKDNQKYFNRAHLIVDAIVVAISYMLAWYLKFESIFAVSDPNVNALPMETYFYALYFIVPGYVILYYMQNLYTPKRATMRRYEIFNIAKANTIGLIAFVVALYTIKQVHFSRSMILMFYFINIILTTVSRGLIRRILNFFRRKGYNLKYILLVGYSRAAEAWQGSPLCVGKG